MDPYSYDYGYYSPSLYTSPYNSINPIGGYHYTTSYLHPSSGRSSKAATDGKEVAAPPHIGPLIPAAWNLMQAEIDWKETLKAHVFIAEVPGLSREEVSVQVDDTGMMLSMWWGKKRDAVDTWRYTERIIGGFYRDVVLPVDADKNEMSVAVENGLLTVTVAKKGEKNPEAVSKTVAKQKDLYGNTVAKQQKLMEKIMAKQLLADTVAKPEKLMSETVAKQPEKLMAETVFKQQLKAVVSTLRKQEEEKPMANVVEQVEEKPVEGSDDDEFDFVLV